MANKHSFIKQIFIEYLLCARHSSRCLKYIDVQNRFLALYSICSGSSETASHLRRAHTQIPGTGKANPDVQVHEAADLPEV